MRGRYLISLILLGLVFLTACEGVNISKVSDEDLERLSEQAIKCEKPYIRFGTSCCLDQNDNKICDRDEKPLEAPAEAVGEGEKELIETKIEKETIKVDAQVSEGKFYLKEPKPNFRFSLKKDATLTYGIRDNLLHLTLDSLTGDMAELRVTEYKNNLVWCQSSYTFGQEDVGTIIKKGRYFIMGGCRYNFEIRLLDIKDNFAFFEVKDMGIKPLEEQSGSTGESTTRETLDPYIIMGNNVGLGFAPKFLVATNIGAGDIIQLGTVMLVIKDVTSNGINIDIHQTSIETFFVPANLKKSIITNDGELEFEVQSSGGSTALNIKRLTNPQFYNDRCYRDEHCAGNQYCLNDKCIQK